MQATIDGFITTLRAGAASSYEATYETTGGSSATIVYAIDPSKGIAFTETPSAGVGPVHIVVNPSGEFSCSTPSGTSGPLSCQALAGGAATVESQLYAYYSPAHWITFLRDFSLAAPLPGDRATTSTRDVNRFKVKCVEVSAAGVPGVSTVCTTAEGIPGYVSVATNPTGFEIESYRRSPPASMFETSTGTTP